MTTRALNEIETKALLAAAGVAVTPTERARTAAADILAAFAPHTSKPFGVIVDAPHRPADAAHWRDDLLRRGVLTFVSPQRAAHALRHSIEYWRTRYAADEEEPSS